MTRVSLFSIFALALSTTAGAADKVLDLSSGCKVYRLQKGKWVPIPSAPFEGSVIPPNLLIKDDTFTAFKAGGKTYGVNRQCVKDRAAEPEPPRRVAAPAPVRGDTHSAWSAVFSLGLNLNTKASKTTTYLGTTTNDTLKYKSAPSFLGEANYRFNGAFRLAGELGISQLAVDSGSGNETSFFDVRPEYVFRATPKLEIYIGPMFGLFFLSQNAELQTLATGERLTVKQQTASALLIGAGLGADYTLSKQFDLGLFFRYFKPGDLKVSAIEEFPTPGNTYDIKLSVGTIVSGLRFVIHF